VGKILFCFSKAHFLNLGEKQFTSLCLILRNVWERICQEFYIVEIYVLFFVFFAIWWSILIFVTIFVLKNFLHNNWLLHLVLSTLVQYFSFSFYSLPLSLVR
jgi:hypothetical protein